MPTNPNTNSAAAWHNGDVYAGHDGNVYRRQDGSWQKATTGGWTPVSPSDQKNSGTLNRRRHTQTPLARSESGGANSDAAEVAGPGTDADRVTMKPRALGYTPLEPGRKKPPPI